MTESSPDEPSAKSKDFICGVVEGFYGRPWTTEQRKDLFLKLKKWGMDMYVYAPKDDYKHRAYWRELYTVEEAEHLTSLISAAKAQGVIFCYALSPGLDITYSSQKEITALKRKLEQVSQFGCTCFALLFDDIEPEMSEADKQTFQSFAHAQVSVTNEIHQHLGCPRFLVCPTQYCAARAVPAVATSEYLVTLGTKLSPVIDIMWTGSKVISKTLTTECIEEITQVLRRPPVIWDNLHANDYDQKRIFLGPYCGRSPELIPRLRGVLTNPNCEYGANLPAAATLARWAACSRLAPQDMEAVSWDIRLERESEQGVDDDAPIALGKNVYHHRQALRSAITEWLPEFAIPKTSSGPVIKPQPIITVPPVPIIPILPSVNTCMSLLTGTSATCTTSTAELAAAVPNVTHSQLRALAPSATVQTSGAGQGLVVSPIETFTAVPLPVMNSLVSPTKVILNESIPNPIIPMASSNISLPTEIPVSTLPVPIMGLKPLEDIKDQLMDMEKIDKDMEKSETDMSESVTDEKRDKEDSTEIIVDEAEVVISEQLANGDMSVGDTPVSSSPLAEDATDVLMADPLSENGAMQVEGGSPLSADMMVEPDPFRLGDQSPDDSASDNNLTTDDLMLLCDLFYLPFEHGSRGLRLLNDFNWLLNHATSVLPRGNKSETGEWTRRRGRFAWWSARARRLTRRVAAAPNGELRAELRPYVWDVAAALALLDGFTKWLELGKFPANILSNTQGSYTWFSKGWREAFESGAQEPWVFRGGLAADLRRLLPVECGADALQPSAPPPGLPLAMRPYRNDDDAEIYQLYVTGGAGSALFPPDLQELPADRLIQPFLTLSADLCMVLEEDPRDLCGDVDLDDDTDPASLIGPMRLAGCACGSLNARALRRRAAAAWAPAMQEKYPATLLARTDLTDEAKEYINDFHRWDSAMEAESLPAAALERYPAIVSARASPKRDRLAPARLLACLLAAMRAHGVPGVHVCIAASDQNQHQFYTKLGFVEVHRTDTRAFLARGF